MSTERECNSWCPALSAVLIVVLGLSAVFVWGDAVIEIWEYDPKTIVDVMSTLILMGTLVVAVATYLHQVKYNESKDYLQQSIDLLEKSYQILSSGPPGGNQLSNRRQDWLTTVRLIQAAQYLGDKINHSAQKNIYTEQFEYWRWMFYELINPYEDTREPGFYAHHPCDAIIHGEDTRDPIDVLSLAFMHRFIKWPEEIPDRMQEVKSFTNAEIHHMESFGPRGLARHLRNVEKCAKQEIKHTDRVLGYPDND